MDKRTFLDRLRRALAGLPETDIQSTLDYYAEMIDDRVDEGMTEAEATADIGAPEDIAEQILLDTPLPKLVKRRVQPDRAWQAWEIVLLVLGAPVWLPLLLTFVIVVFTLFLVLWVFILCLYVMVGAIAVTGVAGVVGAVIHVFEGDFLACAVAFGGGLVCIGLAILLFFAFNQAAAGTAKFSRYLWRSIKGWFIQKENV